MKAFCRIVLGGLLVGMGGMFVPSAPAQIFTNLHHFSAFTGSSSNNYDGATPRGELAFSGNTLYGTASAGGTNGNGTVFAVNIDGASFTNLHDFSSITYLFANRDGARPQAGLLLSGNTLYGTTELGGTNATGTIFGLNTDATGFKTIYSFALLAGVFNPLNNGGAQPHAALAMAGDTLYGTTPTGGHSTFGTAFSVNTNGAGFLTLHDFNALGKFYPNANSDGNQPVSRLVYYGTNLYGTAPDGGANGTGTIFRLSTNGTGFVTLHSFAGLPLSGNTNNEGATPLGALLITNDVIYGAASSGGTNGYGTIFAVNIDGTGFTNFYNFTNGVDGANPHSGLVFADGLLYGAAFNGGTNSDGSLFFIKADGSGFRSFYNFSGSADGANPNGLILSGNTLYGTTVAGGTNGNGTVFKLVLHPNFFAGEVALGRNAYFLIFPATGNLFGYYNYDYFPILYHYDLGFESFINAQDGADGTYFYDFITDHFWYTSPSLFPYLYDFSLDAWIYYYPNPNDSGRYSTNPRFFYNFSTSAIFTQ